MSASPTKPEHDPRVEAVIGLITRLARGEHAARLEPSPARDELDVIIVGLNLLAEEFEASVAAEREARATLEQRVLERTAELEERLAVIAEQRETILQLSTPILEVWDRVLVSPLVGLIDPERAAQMVEQVLAAVIARRAEVVILDVTGLPVVDADVAGHIVTTMRAVRLLGARVVLTGVSPATAQTIVRLGVDFGEILTRATLHAGLTLATQLTGAQR